MLMRQASSKEAEMTQVAKRMDVTDHKCAVEDCTTLAAYGIWTPEGIIQYCESHIAVGRARHYAKYPWQQQEA